MSPTRMDWLRPYGAHSTSMALPWSASQSRSPKSRRLHPFSTDRSSKRLLNNKSRSHRRTTQMSLPALDDIVTHTGITVPIDGVVRIETTPLEQTAGTFFSQLRSVYPHQEVFGQYCTVNDYVDCPPDELFAYLSDTRSLEEWTYTLRGFTPTEEPGLWLAYDKQPPATEIY